MSDGGDGLARLQRELDSCQDELEVFRDELDFANQACEQKDSKIAELQAALDERQAVEALANASTTELRVLESRLQQAYAAAEKWHADCEAAQRALKRHLPQTL